jgi:hypothetical protein
MRKRIPLLTFRPLSLSRSLFGLLVFAALFAISGCDGGFVETKSNGIAVEPQQIEFSALGRGQTKEDKIITISQSGEKTTTIKEIYLVSVDEAGTLTPIEGCDRVTEGVPRDQVLTPSVLPTCNIIITERPLELPVTLNEGESKQVMVTFRPLSPDDQPNVRLIVESDVVANRTLEVNLGFTQGYPEISGESAVEFPGPSRDNYIIRNDGSAPLLITNIYIEAADPVNFPPYRDPESGETTLEFTADSNSTLPITIDQSTNNVGIISIEYAPLDEGVDKAKMIIKSETITGVVLPDFEVLLTSETIPAELVVNPSTVTFNHQVGQREVQQLDLRNTGIRSISILGLSIEPEGSRFSLNSTQSTSFPLSGGDVREIALIYQPAESPEEGTLVIQTDADNASEGYIRVPLTTNISEGLKVLGSTESILNFDRVAGGGSMELTLTLVSEGTAEVNLTDLNFTEGSDVDVFTLGDWSAGPLAPGETTEVTITFTRPSDEPVANTYQASLSAQSDSAAGDVIITLIANP